MTEILQKACAGRTRIDLSEGWDFVLGNAGRWWLRGGREQRDAVVSLPHSWNARDTFQQGFKYYRGYGCYRRVFSLPAECRNLPLRWRIVSEGFYGTGDVRLNGTKIAEVDGQYLGFQVDTADALLHGAENIVGIRITNKCRSYVLPGFKDPDFLLHGGLAGRVWLEGVPELHIDLPRTRILTCKSGSRDASAAVELVVVNRSEKTWQCTASCAIEDAGGRLVGQASGQPVNVPAGAEAHLAVSGIAVADVATWSDVHPALYTARCTVSENGKVTDECVRRFGFRDAEFRPRQGFFLNGERVELRGCNRHESMPGFGNALPAELQREDAEIIKKAGLNFVRLSHYPQSGSFLDACDELGIMVYAEIASWKSVRTGRWLKRACRQMHDMILRDRHRPSIILWGMGNESRSRRAFIELRNIAESFDPGRPVIYAENHLYRARREKTIGSPDVWGLNYEMDEIEEGCEASILKNVVVSECANNPHTYRGVPVEELKQVEMIERDLDRLSAIRHVAGFAIWCFNDYATYRKKRYLRHSGLVDAWRVPKMSFAYLRARYSSEPVLAVESGPPGTGQIHIFTNCEKVMVIHNGTEVAGFEGKPHLVCRGRFDRGEVVVKGTLKGQVLEERLFLDAVAARIDIEVDKTGQAVQVGHVFGVLLRITDAAGHKVSGWNGDVQVTVDGPGEGCYFRKDRIVSVSAGTGRVFVKRTGAGSISIKAVCVGLSDGDATTR